MRRVTLKGCCGCRLSHFLDSVQAGTITVQTFKTCATIPGRCVLNGTAAVATPGRFHPRQTAPAVAREHGDSEKGERGYIIYPNGSAREFVYRFRLPEFRFAQPNRKISRALRFPGFLEGLNRFIQPTLPISFRSRTVPTYYTTLSFPSQSGSGHFLFRLHPSLCHLHPSQSITPVPCHPVPPSTGPSTGCQSTRLQNHTRYAAALRYATLLRSTAH